MEREWERLHRILFLFDSGKKKTPKSTHIKWKQQNEFLSSLNYFLFDYLILTKIFWSIIYWKWHRNFPLILRNSILWWSQSFLVGIIVRFAFTVMLTKRTRWHIVRCIVWTHIHRCSIVCFTTFDNMLRQTNWCQSMLFIERTNDPITAHFYNDTSKLIRKMNANNSLVPFTYFFRKISDALKMLFPKIYRLDSSFDFFTSAICRLNTTCFRINNVKQFWQ